MCDGESTSVQRVIVLFQIFVYLLTDIAGYNWTYCLVCYGKKYSLSHGKSEEARKQIGSLDWTRVAFSSLILYKQYGAHRYYTPNSLKIFQYCLVMLESVFLSVF